MRTIPGNPKVAFFCTRLIWAQKTYLLRPNRTCMQKMYLLVFPSVGLLIVSDSFGRGTFSFSKCVKRFCSWMSSLGFGPKTAIKSKIKEARQPNLMKHDWCKTLGVWMQHVNVNKWPEAAPFKTKRQIGIHSVNFRVCSGNFRVCFWRQCTPKMACPNSPIDTAARPCHRLLKAFNHPINSRWVQTTMPQYMNLCYDVSWTSDPSGNVCANDSFSLNLFFCLSSWRPRRPNKQAVSVYSNFWKKNAFVCEHLSKNVIVWKNIVFQSNTSFFHSYGCLGTCFDKGFFQEYVYIPVTLNIKKSCLSRFNPKTSWKSSTCFANWLCKHHCFYINQAIIFVPKRTCLFIRQLAVDCYKY